eukprot:CAMPEP_0183712252 /NCGR_PEP_ID=MMETSP0737-20130205/7422_1 /TAXON_ID=385413 /ORGANISM="Thalassiosira miniscula, Strain CCMP1093" /LENGTH=280 /DNA_ID=CAMNT_0025940831 /DNA_START=440 /DNA_END=1282 /DNA_ORIENTATION=-
MHEGAEKAGATVDAAPASSELEIEKKFAIPDARTAEKIEQTLASLDFQISRREEFVDWYFDLPAPRWHFSLQDCWLRYREKKIKIMNNWGWKGAWQVKRGRREDHGGIDATERDGMTVYQELQGKAAKELILDMLAKLDGADASDASSDPPSSWTNSYNGYDIPYLAGAESLVPFARLVTFRTCYESTNLDGEFSALKVDIDKTDFRYMVGEVEAVLDGASEEKANVQAAKEKIEKLVDLISCSVEKGSDQSMLAMGKLEFFLINNHRDHYDACIKSGVM